MTFGLTSRQYSEHRACVEARKKQEARKAARRAARDLRAEVMFVRNGNKMWEFHVGNQRGLPFRGSRDCGDEFEVLVDRLVHGGRQRVAIVDATPLKEARSK